MYKPAARLGDATSHGGTIVGGCARSVLVAGVPAARLGDNHSCPMTSPAPHVGGPIVNASATVLIEGMPAARVGDAAACSGPADSIVAGCPTVLVGDRAGRSAPEDQQAAQDAPPGPTRALSYKVLARDKPLEGARCRLFVDGRELPSSPQPDSAGVVTADVQADAGICYLIVSSEGSDDELHIPMLVGTLKPLSAPARDDDPHAEHAARQRLLQLGFFDNGAPYHYEVALKDFQLYKGLDPTARLDADTCGKLDDYSEEVER